MAVRRSSLTPPPFLVSQWGTSSLLLFWTEGGNLEGGKKGGAVSGMFMEMTWGKMGEDEGSDGRVNKRKKREC